MATIAIERRGTRRVSRMWIALLVAAGLTAGTLAVVRTMASSPEAVERSTGFTFTEGVGQVRALNESAAVTASSGAISFQSVLDVRALNRPAAAMDPFVGRVLHSRALNEPQLSTKALDVGAIAAGRTLNEPVYWSSAPEQPIIDLRSLNR